MKTIVIFILTQDVRVTYPMRLQTMVVVVLVVLPALAVVVVVVVLAMVEAVPVVRPLEVVVAAVAMLPVPAVVAIPVLAMTPRAVSNNVVDCFQQVAHCFQSYRTMRRWERMRPSVPAHRKLRREIGSGHRRHRRRLVWATEGFVAAVV